MPIKIADGLPAQSILENEHIFVMTEYRALHQDIRPLKIGLLNLMPTKIVTETQNRGGACGAVVAQQQKHLAGASSGVLQKF